MYYDYDKLYLHYQFVLRFGNCHCHVVPNENDPGVMRFLCLLDVLFVFDSSPLPPSLLRIFLWVK